MNKLKLFNWLVFVAFLALQGCVNKDEQLKKEIIGEYSCAITEESEEDGITMIISINGTCAFNSDNSCEDNATFAITYIDEEGYQTNVKYQLVASGSYDIQKSHIIYDYDLNNIAITLLQTDNYEISDLFSEHYIPQLKQEMLVNNRERILELTDKFLKTEDEIEGEKTTMTYVKLSDSKQ